MPEGEHQNPTHVSGGHEEEGKEMRDAARLMAEATRQMAEAGEQFSETARRWANIEKKFKEMNKGKLALEKTFSQRATACATGSVQAGTIYEGGPVRVIYEEQLRKTAERMDPVAHRLGNELQAQSGFWAFPTRERLHDCQDDWKSQNMKLNQDRAGDGRRQTTLEDLERSNAEPPLSFREMGIINKAISKVKKIFGRKGDKDDKADEIHLVSGQPRAASNLLAVEQAALTKAALNRTDPLPSSSKPLPPTPPSKSSTPSPAERKEEAELV